VLEQVDGTIREFRVANVEVVDATRSRIRIDAPASMLVLTTCYPFDSWRAGGPLRYVVTAHTVAAAAP
jgi:sortase (surface protein transpeptidase)